MSALVITCASAVVITCALCGEETARESIVMVEGTHGATVIFDICAKCDRKWDPAAFIRVQIEALSAIAKAKPSDDEVPR